MKLGKKSCGMGMAFYAFHALPAVVVPPIPLLYISACPERLLLALALPSLFYIAIKFGVNRIALDGWSVGQHTGGGNKRVQGYVEAIQA
jgi:hypothetical protein